MGKTGRLFYSDYSGGVFDWYRMGKLGDFLTVIIVGMFLTGIEWGKLEDFLTVIIVRDVFDWCGMGELGDFFTASTGLGLGLGQAPATTHAPLEGARNYSPRECE